jgi:hypothetical protein
MRGRRARVAVVAIRDRKGQAAVEWVVLTMLAALLMLALIGASGGLAGTGLAREVAERMVCAVRLQIPCRHDPRLLAAYDPELAGLLREHAPLISYERGMRSLPVDYRVCRSPACADGAGSGRTITSFGGHLVTAFTHVIDCRRPNDPVPVEADCTGSSRGNLYLQYWLYYPDSATHRGLPVLDERGFHLDDWESFQVRVGPGGSVMSRASSHNGYNGVPSVGDWASDASGKIPGASSLRQLSERLGLRETNGWTPVLRSRSLLLVAGGSHAGRAGGTDRRIRWTPPAALRLVPIEALSGERSGFAVTPPWLKRVYRAPEHFGTD